MSDVYFKAHLTDSIFFKPAQLYDENRKVLQNLEHIDKGNIYFIAERGRVRVDAGKLKLSKNGRLRLVLILCDGRRVQHEIDTAPLFIGLGEVFKQVFGTAEKLQSNIRRVSGEAEYRKLLGASSPLPVIGISLAADKQTNKNVAIRLFTPDGQVSDMPFNVHSIISVYQIDVEDSPSIVYIGKSTSLQDRIYKHEKIQQALAVLDDDADIYLYAFQFDTDKLVHKRLPDGTCYLERNYTSDVSEDDTLAIVEMALINYFKPRLNDKYVHADIPRNPVFSSALRGKYTEMTMEVIHDEGSYWRFGSDHVTASESHTARYRV